MRELVLMSAMALLGAGCVEVIPHIQDFDAGPDTVVADVTGEPDVMLGKCMSGRRWTGGKGTALMNPGVPCMGPGCHSPTSKSPIEPMTMAGTIYPLGGERDENDCNGIDPVGIALAVMDDAGMEVIPRIQLNQAGNFYTSKALPDTYKVKIIQQGREVPMIAPVNGRMNGGDCNFCHQAVDYMGAKGRIVPPRPN